MSNPNAQPHDTTPFHDAAQPTDNPLGGPANPVSDITEVMQRVRRRITPVWPLKDFVAVNPYAGFADQEFLTARQSLRNLSDADTLMPVDYYREQFAAGELCRADIDAAVDELVADGVIGAERIDVNQVIALLQRPHKESPSSDSAFVKAVHPDRTLRAFAEVFDRHHSSQWSRLVMEEISKHCAAHYDQGQAVWPSPWQRLTLYQAWRSTALHDRRFEILGVPGFRKMVAGLPHDPHAALVVLLNRLETPAELWEDYLLCELLTMPGWSAWAKYQFAQAERRGEENTDLAGLLAMRLAYAVALSESSDFRIDWAVAVRHRRSNRSQPSRPCDEDLLRYAMLKGSEIAFRKRLLEGMTAGIGQTDQSRSDDRSLAQMVFCIDVRSERIRRNLESASAAIETFGFAGFFGLPFEFVPMGEQLGSAQVPALISPRFAVQEEVDGDQPGTRSAIARRSRCRFLRKSWKEFQASAAGCFAFVETAGLFYGFHLLTRSIGMGTEKPSRYDGVKKIDRHRLAPALGNLDDQDRSASDQGDMAESVLRGIGIVKDFARLVVLCGHTSDGENNPLQGSLDCGACGGHSGEPNARFAARLLNQKEVRASLAERGIEIPSDTFFVAALHNTTTDELSLFDTHQIPASHQDDLQELRSIARSASHETGRERLPLLRGPGLTDLVRRSRDWSETRPEWGLAGNVAFIAGPRDATRSVVLHGRSFLHSYEYRNDRDFAVLEQIMTAPLVVANWINMQYYASTVDPTHFGSGNKTVHNVVGQFGLFSGNGGDLMTGLPWQSIHDGDRYQHHPLRLLAVIAAPRDAIEAILRKHDTVANLVTNGWVQLVADDESGFARYTAAGTWEQLAPGGTQQMFELVRSTSEQEAS